MGDWHWEQSWEQRFRYEEDQQSSLLLNGGFESSLANWQSCADVDGSSIVSDSSEGGSALQITSADCLFQEFAVSPNQTYTVQCQAKGEQTQYTSMTLTIMDQGYSELVSQEVEVTSSAYQAHSATVSVPGTGAIGAVTFYSEDIGLFDACSVVQE